jgi:cystathionine beta-lyase
MWVADMDFKSPAQVIDALIRRAEHGVFGYTVPSESLSKALLGWLERRHQWEIDNSWLVHSPGVVTSVNISILAFTEVGDKILLQTPIYYPFYSSIQENQRELVTNPLQNNNGFYEIDFADLEEKLGNGVKMMVFCSPHNPIGRVWRQNELEEVARLCRQYNVILISDEIHSDLVYKGYKHIPIAPLSEEVLRNSVTLISPTKTFNLAGLCQSTAIIPNAGLRQRFINTISRTGAGMLNIFGLEAAEVAYSCCEDWLEELMIYLQKNLEITEEYFKKYIPQIKVIRPEATYLAWLDCKQLPLEMEKLKEFFTFRAGVGLNDGITFGKEGLGFQRLNFACPRTLLREGLERIRKAVSELYA